jgi:Tol biopolymer transport system component/predicted Ser/Thr protein kinase
MLLSSGDRLGPYEILGPIGAGGMGQVWKARDPRLDRIVAVKVSHEKFSERFALEARSVAALNHPHICQLYDVGPDYLVMEFIEGAPLKGPLPLDKAVEYAGQILDALDAAHHKGITHRDLKPANILVTKQGIKLLDFGLAKQAVRLTEQDPTKALTEQGQILGTLQYMSPEQLQGKEVDTRSDLFSFGCVLYEMLTGKRAFSGESAASVMAAILEREPAPLTVAPQLERIVKRSLAKDPDQRFQTARDLKAALAWAMEQPPPSGAVSPRRSLWIPIAATALLVGALGGWAVSHFRRPVDERVVSLEIDPPEGARFVIGTLGGFALSPDGKTAAYIASSDGKRWLWVRRLDSVTARMLPGTEGASYPFWSPDNKSVAFFTSSKLLRVDVAGGAPLLICAAIQGRGGAWSNEGQILFATLGSGLFQVPASGGAPSVLTTPNASRGELVHRWPQVIPGGRFLCWVRSDKPENTGLYAGSLAKPAGLVRLLTADSGVLYVAGNDDKDYLLWVRGVTLLAQEFNVGSLKLVGDPHPLADPVASIGANGQMNVAASATGFLLYSSSNTSSQFTWFDRAGKPLGVVGEPGEYGPFRLSPDGRRAAVARRSDLWLLEMDRGVSTRFASNSVGTMFTVWSPDSRTIVYNKGGMFSRDSTGAGTEQQVAETPNIQAPTDWSRDGRVLMYLEVAPGVPRSLWTLAVSPDGTLAAGAKPKPYLRTGFNAIWGRFSPETNPRWVAYQWDESGRDEIYIQSFPEPRSPTRISTEGGQYPQWGPEGRELYFLSPDNKLMMVSLKLGADSVEPSAPQELFPLPTNAVSFSPYEVAPDGQRFLVRATPQQFAQPLTVIVNWPALLKKAVAP